MEIDEALGGTYLVPLASLDRTLSLHGMARTLTDLPLLTGDRLRRAVLFEQREIAAEILPRRLDRLRSNFDYIRQDIRTREDLVRLGN